MLGDLGYAMDDLLMRCIIHALVNGKSALDSRSSFWLATRYCTLLALHGNNQDVTGLLRAGWGRAFIARWPPSAGLPASASRRAAAQCTVRRLGRRASS